MLSADKHAMHFLPASFRVKTTKHKNKKTTKTTTKKGGGGYLSSWMDGIRQTAQSPLICSWLSRTRVQRWGANRHCDGPSISLKVGNHGADELVQKIMNDVGAFHAAQLEELSVGFIVKKLSGEKSKEKDELWNGCHTGGISAQLSEFSMWRYGPHTPDAGVPDKERAATFLLLTSCPSYGGTWALLGVAASARRHRLRKETEEVFGHVPGNTWTKDLGASVMSLSIATQAQRNLAYVCA